VEECFVEVREEFNSAGVAIEREAGREGRGEAFPVLVLEGEGEGGKGECGGIRAIKERSAGPREGA